MAQRYNNFFKKSIKFIDNQDLNRTFAAVF